MESTTIDLDALDTVRGAEQGFDLELRAPNGKPLPGHLRVRGYDAETYQAKSVEQQRRLIEKTTSGRMPTPEQLRDEELELAATLILGWTCPFQIKGEPFPYSEVNAQQLLRRYPWVREQVERAARQRANFLPGSASA